MPNPIIKWVKRNTHSYPPPLFPEGLKGLTRPLLSLLPPSFNHLSSAVLCPPCCLHPRFFLVLSGVFLRKT